MFRNRQSASYWTSSSAAWRSPKRSWWKRALGTSYLSRPVSSTSEFTCPSTAPHTILILLRLRCRYKHFIVLLVSSQTAKDHLESCGLVESKVRFLITSLELNQHISLVHVNPKCFERSKSIADANADADDKLVSAPFCSMWFIGLQFERTEKLNIDLTETLRNFREHVHKHAASTHNLIDLQKPC